MAEEEIKYKIAAVVVTYNRLTLLQECIASLRNQTRKLDEIIIVNNSSTDGTFEWLNVQKDLSIVTQENSGSAGGQHTGIKTAYEKGYDWIWCMDDDGYPDKNCLATLVGVIQKDKPEVVSPIVLDKNNNHQLAFYSPILKYKIFIDSTISKAEFLKYSADDLIEEWGFFFNGIMISKAVISRLGLPIRELFIWGDEVEYFIRFKKNNVRMLTYSKAIFFHPKSKLITKKMIFNKYAYEGNVGERFYYLFRNRGFMAKKYFKFFDVKYVLSQCLYYLLHRKLDFKSTFFFLKAYIDGIKLKVSEK